MIERGQTIECAEKPEYIDGITKGRKYVASKVQWSHDKQYVTVLGDDNRGHWLPANLFKPPPE